MENIRELDLSGLGNRRRVSYLVHTDVWGSTQLQSLGGSHYYVTFIDDATRKKMGLLH